MFGVVLVSASLDLMPGRRIRIVRMFLIHDHTKTIESTFKGEQLGTTTGVPKCSPQADVPPRFIWHVSVESFSRRVNLEHSLLGRFGLGFHRVKSQKGSWHLKAKRCPHSGDLNSVFTGAVSFLAPGTLFLSFILVLPFF